MLRAGICDLGICDLEMDCPVGPARPARWASVRLVRPAQPRSRPPRKEGTIRTRTPGPPPGVRSAASSASQRRFPPRGPLTCGVTIWRAMICRLYPAMRRVSRRAAAHFRPGCRAFPPREALAFPPGRYRAFPRACRGVSAGIPRRFRRTAARAATRSRRGRPHGSGAGARRRPLPRRAIHFPGGRPDRESSSAPGRRSAAEVRPGPGEADPEDDPALALHRRPVVVPVGVLPGDPAVVVIRSSIASGR